MRAGALSVWPTAGIPKLRAVNVSEAFNVLVEKEREEQG